jgi:hypothetical protein
VSFARFNPCSPCCDQSNPCPSITGFKATQVPGQKFVFEFWLSQGVYQNTACLVLYSGVANAFILAAANGYGIGLLDVPLPYIFESGGIFLSSGNAPIGSGSPCYPSGGVYPSGSCPPDFSSYQSGEYYMNSVCSFPFTCSTVATGVLSNCPPYFSHLNSDWILRPAGTSNLGIVVVSGYVWDEVPAGLVVTFGGPREFNGHTTLVQADGSFSSSFGIFYAGAIGETGIVKITDWYGLRSTCSFVVPS